MLGGLNWFEKRVNLTPQRTAVIDSESNDAWTYGELNARAETLAVYLQACGVQKGDRVAILAHNHIAYFDFLFASMKLGAIFAPFNWRFSNMELQYIEKDCRPKIIGVAPAFKEKWKAVESDAKVLHIDNNDNLDILTNGRVTCPAGIRETDPLAIIYTGGTTGYPKGVVLSHRSILWNAINTLISWNVHQEDAVLTALPMFHTGGLNVLSLPLLLAGGKVIISADFKPEKAVKDMITYKCTIAFFVPTMYHMMIQTDIFQKSAFPDVKVFLSGGAPCPQRIYDVFAEKGLAFKEGYGLTEAGPNNFYIDPQEAMAKRGSVGKPMLFNDIKIVKECGDAAGINEVGELLLCGYHSFEYYWNEEDRTKQTILDSWVHTGDLAKRDEDGYVYIVGRKKDMIISGGENVYPSEIEHWLESHEHVEEAAVVGLPDEKWGEAVTAFVHLNKETDEEELIDFCSQKLAKYKVPKQFIFVDGLPKTHVGKVDKSALRELVAAEMNKP